MPHNDCDKVTSAIRGVTWAILPEALDAIVAIASREYSDTELAAAIRTDRAVKMRTLTALAGDAAVIPVFGPIVPRGGLFANVSGAVSVDGISACLDAALEDEAIKSIILNFDSPGGQVTGIYQLCRQIVAAGMTKPVTAYVSGMAASAAYWLACSCGRIVADKTATVGSIGACMFWSDDSIAKAASGVREEMVVSTQSPNKNLDPNTPAGRMEVQELVNAHAAIFIQDVATFRGVAEQRVRESFGQGSMLLADAALAAGMIDSVGLMDSILVGGHDRREHSMKESGMAVTASHFAPAAGGKVKTATDEDDKQNKDEEDEDNARAKAEKDEEEEKKEKDEAEAKRKAAAAKHPDIYEAAFAAGVAAERARLQEIRELGLSGHKQLVDDAMFKTFMTAGETAIAYAKAESKLKSTCSQARLEESATINIPVASEPAALNKDQEAIAAMVAGMR